MVAPNCVYFPLPSHFFLTFISPLFIGTGISVHLAPINSCLLQHLISKACFSLRPHPSVHPSVTPSPISSGWTEGFHFHAQSKSRYGSFALFPFYARANECIGVSFAGAKTAFPSPYTPEDTSHHASSIPFRPYPKSKLDILTYIIGAFLTELPWQSDFINHMRYRTVLTYTCLLHV